MKPLVCLASVVTAMATVGAVAPAQASEGGLGRPITGMQAASFSGLVPPTPGWNMAVSYLYYAGEIGAERESPIPGGGSALGLHLTAQMFSVSAVYIWDTGEGRWNFASVAAVPIAKIDAGVDLRIGSLSGSVSDSDTGLFDMTFVPVVASCPFQPDQAHVARALHLCPDGFVRGGPVGRAQSQYLGPLAHRRLHPIVPGGYARVEHHGGVSTPGMTPPTTRTARTSASTRC